MIRGRFWAIVTAVVSTAAFLVLAVGATNRIVWPLDRAAQAWVVHERHRGLELPMQALAILGSGCVLFLAGAAAYFVLRRAGSRLARPIPTISLGAFALYTLTNWLIARPRPSGHGPGFPSGHTMGATVFFGYVVWAVRQGGLGPRWRWTVTMLACAFVVGIAYCRLYFNVHWLTDVAGGFTGGLAYLVLALLAFERQSATH